jgi:hypothetical protein
MSAIYAAEIEWSKPEWADGDSEALVAYAQGYELEIGPSRDRASKWDWLAKVTAEISETPEVLGTGTASSESGAKRAAAIAANRDMRERKKGERKAAKAKEAEAKTTLEPGPAPDAGEMFDGVEAELAEAMKPKRARKTAAVAAE